MYPSRQQARLWARGLGWLSIGLGVAELVTARPLARSVGLRGRGAVVAGYGIREVATGVGLLNTDRPAPWLWARVAGDVLDVVSLVVGARRHPRHSRGASIALAAVAGVTLVDLVCARRLSGPPKASRHDYRGRSGWPLPADEMRGAALDDFEPPPDLRIPEALRPWPRELARQ